MTGCAIAEIGTVSALGYDAENACAAARAGLSRVASLDVKNFEEEEKWGGGPIYGHSISTLGRGFVGSGKAILLGEYALRGLMAKARKFGINNSRTGYYLHLSDYAVIGEADRRDHDETIAEDRDVGLSPQGAWIPQGTEIHSTILRRAGLEADPCACHISHGDHVGFLKLIEASRVALLNGSFDSCIVGAIDSKVEPRYLDAASKLLMLRTEEYSAGFIPGEAAGFLLLKREIDLPGDHSAVRISGLEVADEGASYLDETRPAGRALAEVLSSVSISNGAGESELPGVLIGDLNGWEARSADWGNAVMRLTSNFDLSHVPLWMPAMSFGEIGAATGPVAISLAMAAHRRGYAPSGTSIIWLASLTGCRGALRLNSYK